MRDIIARQKRKTLAACEDDPCALLVSPVLKHFIYADQRDETTTLKELGDALGCWSTPNHLRSETWDADLQKLASSADERVWVVSRPSAAEAARQRDEEESRKQATIKREGPEGLKALQTKLDKAQEVNERDIPSEMLSCVPSQISRRPRRNCLTCRAFPVQRR